MIGLGFASDRFREWREFSGTIAERGKERPMQSQIIADYFGHNCCIWRVWTKHRDLSAAGSPIWQCAIIYDKKSSVVVVFFDFQICFSWLFLGNWLLRRRRDRPFFMNERWHIYAWAEYPKLVVMGLKVILTLSHILILNIYFLYFLRPAF